MARGVAAGVRFAGSGDSDTLFREIAGFLAAV
jgi:hypothetical protein